MTAKTPSRFTPVLHRRFTQMSTGLEKSMQVFQETSAWQLAAHVAPTPYGHHLIISSFIPTARRPEHQVKFSGTFSTYELRALRDTIDAALGEHNNG
jgi:hypothetical protein